MDDLLGYLKFKLSDLLELIDRDVRAYELLKNVNDIERKINANAKVLAEKDVDMNKVNMLLRDLKEYALAYGFTSNVPYIPFLMRRTNPIKEEIKRKIKELILEIIDLISKD